MDRFDGPLGKALLAWIEKADADRNFGSYLCWRTSTQSLMACP